LYLPLIPKIVETILYPATASSKNINYFCSKVYTIIDIETTGGSPLKEKITEIAIFVHDGQQVVEEFSTLINPEKYIPAHITTLTGITNEMVADAPKFYEVAKKVVELTENRLFVAHNSNFDYRFVQQEFKNLGYTFNREQICTVKLSRKLIPGHQSYSLGKLCSQLGIHINGRHRAAGDAMATVKLFELLLSLHGFNDGLFATVSNISTRGLHPSFDIQILRELPDTAGVYYFLNENGDIIYVGKSKNIKTRVLSHFQNNGTKKAIEMRENIATIDFVATGSELVALLMESDEIKKHKPRYNRAQRRAMQHHGIYRFIDENGYINLKTGSNETTPDVPLVSYTLKSEALQHLNILMSEYRLCQKLCGTYPTTGPCFHNQVGLCNGACVGEEGPDSYNERVEMALKKYHYPDENFMIIDEGRNAKEKSVVRVEQGKYMGFGFFDVDEAAAYPSILEDCISYKKDNRDILMILKTYLMNNKVEKIMRF
jgi:DNA polymerase III subunit epsilon